MLQIYMYSRVFIDCFKNVYHQVLLILYILPMFVCDCVYQPLQPFVHIWDSKTLVTLQQIGLGTFERGVGSVAFSNAVSIPSQF